jgi:hypothetical protein
MRCKGEFLSHLFSVLVFLLGVFPLHAQVPAREIAASLDDSTLCAQVILAAYPDYTTWTRLAERILTETPAGGIMLFKYNVDIDKPALKALLTKITDFIGSRVALGSKIHATVPPFMAIDH